MTPIVWLDTETTSLGPDRRAWEVAMIRRDDTGTRERRFFVKNVDLAQADMAALRVGGFYDRHPQYAGDASDDGFVTRTLAGPVGPMLLERYEAARKVEYITRGAVIVGANPGFDLETLARLLRSVHLFPAWHYTPVNVKAMALGWLAGRGQLGDLTATSRSDDLAAACGVEPAPDVERHTALGDARWVQRWYDHLTGAA